MLGVLNLIIQEVCSEIEMQPGCKTCMKNGDIKTYISQIFLEVLNFIQI